MRLFAFNLGTEIVDMANFDPLGPEVGTKVHTPYFAYLIEHQRGYVLFDTGAHSRFITEEGSAPPTTGPRIIMRGHEHVVARLESLGIAPADVGHVVLSHLHIDHAGGLESFPDALTYVQRRELEFAHCPPVYQRPFYVPGDFAGPRAWSELSGTFDLFGDERLILFSTPGHSAGHQSMLVRLPGRPVILVGDAAYSPRNLEQRVLPAIVWSPDATVESWDKIERWRDRHDALLIFTHDLMWRTGTRLGPAEWYE